MAFIPKIEYTELITLTPKVITFDSPPEGDPFNERRRMVSQRTLSSSGISQVQHNYALQIYKLKFLFQSVTVRDSLIDWLENHAGKGGSFNYFPDKDIASFETYELTDYDIQLDRPIPNGAGDFEYNFEFTIERVL